MTMTMTTLLLNVSKYSLHSENIHIYDLQTIKYYVLYLCMETNHGN